MNAIEFEALLQHKANVANQIAGYVAANQAVPADLLDNWKRMDNQVAARLDLPVQWEVTDGE